MQNTGDGLGQERNASAPQTSTCTQSPGSNATSDSAGLGPGPRLCLSHQLPGDADAAHLRTRPRGARGLPGLHAALILELAVVQAGRRDIFDSNLRVPIRKRV